MRIFVTGGTGFIGKHVIKKLLVDGHDVALLEYKLAETDKIAGQLKQFKPEAVLHLAWEGIPDYGEEASAKNLVYGKNLLKVAEETNCKMFISTGSCWEYGGEYGKLREDDPLNPKNPFASAKVMLCDYAKKWADEKNIKFFWLRIFYAYGPGQKSSSLIPHVINSFKNSADPQIKNLNGGNDFVYIDDVVQALAAVLKKSAGLKSSIFNIGSGKLIGVREVVRIIGKHYDPNFSESSGSLPSGFYADISKIEKETGWSPKVSIEEGIIKTIKYFEF